jgi:hypothetical protein
MLDALRRLAALDVAPRRESLAAMLHGEDVDGTFRFVIVVNHAVQAPDDQLTTTF